MNYLRSVPLALATLWILVTPSCQNRFKAGTVEITNPSGARTLRSEFHDGELGRIGHGAIFRATLQDGSTILIESKEAAEPGK